MSATTAIVITILCVILFVALMIVVSSKKRSLTARILSIIGAVFSMIIMFSALFMAFPPQEESTDSTVSDVTESTEEDTTYVSSDAEIILMQIAEDVAARIAQNPSTVDFSTLEWGFSRDGRIYAVQGTFSCSNLMGVSETHVLQVWCEASEDYSKIQPYRVVLDGNDLKVNN